MKKVKLISLLTATLFSVSGAYADSTYNYVGNAFTGHSGDLAELFEQITISLTFDQPLVPYSVYSDASAGAGATLTDWTISDGLFSLGPASPDLFFNYMFSTDQSGRINVWAISAQTTDSTGVQVSDYSNSLYDMATIGIPTPDGEDDSFAFIYGSPGTWSVGPASVPEPGNSLVLMLGALAAAAVYGMRKSRA